MAKTLMILGAGLEQSIAISKAKSMGLNVVAVDGNPDAPGLKIAGTGICADIKDVRAMVDIGRAYRIDGVMTHAVEIPQVVAQVALELGLPGLDPAIAERATNKFKRIQCFQANGIPCARFQTADTVEEAEKKAPLVGFPCVMKPVDNAGARGVRRVDGPAGVPDAFREAVHYAKNDKTVLIEQYLEGIEISTESVICDGKIITTGFGDRNYTRKKEFEPYFIEDGHNVPSVLPATVQKKIVDTVENAIRALGIDWGVAKGDILMTDDDIYVLEMAARTSGGWFCAGTVPIATGVNILDPLIKMSIGDPVSALDLQPRCHKAACQRYIIPTEEGEFERIDGIDRALMMPGVRMFVTFGIPGRGTHIKKSTNNGERYGQLIAEGETIDDSVRKCEDAMRQIRIVVKNEP